MLIPQLWEQVDRYREREHEIPAARRKALDRLTVFLRATHEQREQAMVLFVCTHNSRRSQLAQFWALVGAHHFGVGNVDFDSGGTVVREVHPAVISTLRSVGASVEASDALSNPRYTAIYAFNDTPAVLYSKRIEDAMDLSMPVCAVFTCSDADSACPILPGAEERILLPYEDPGRWDDTPEEAVQYRALNDIIARDMLYATYHVHFPILA